LPRPPRLIVATQRAGPRFAALEQRFEAEAARRGVRWVLLDPLASDGGAAAPVYERALAETGGRGFDDVVTIAPDLNSIAQAYRLLAPGGGLNVFAGVPVGSTAPLDLTRVWRDGVRLWGTSGSTIADLREIVRRVESGALDTDTVVAAVGGIGAVAEGLMGVRDARFLGKTVIYPQLADLPLLSVAELAERYPGVGERLTTGRYWNRDAEAELLRLHGMGRDA
jgi:threonine dehydrogenase-like Zn-dependent dehydrogenase